MYASTSSRLAGAFAAWLSASVIAQTPLPNVQTIIDERVEAGLTPALAVGLIRPDGVREMFFAGTLRSGGEVRVDENTVFEIGSISKVFTGVLLARMSEEGQLNLSDSAANFLPAEVTLSPDITLHHLATHTSGLPRMPDNLTPADPRNPYADYTVQQMYTFLSERADPTPVGGTPDYSNLGMGLLGHVLEQRSGRSYDQLVQEKIAQPLGMDSTTTKPAPEDAARVAGAHVGTNPVSGWDIPTLAGAGDLNSTLKDMMVFTAANLGYVETDLQDAFTTSHQPRAKDPDGVTQIGLGWHRTGSAGRDIIWHNGSTGGFSSFMGFRPDTGEGVVVLSNGRYSGVDRIGFHLLNSANRLDTFRKTARIDPAILSDYLGRYQILPGVVFTITRQGDQLFAELTGQPALSIDPVGRDEFVYRGIDASLTFERNEDGTIERLTLHQNGLKQVASKVDEPQTAPLR